MRLSRASMVIVVLAVLAGWMSRAGSQPAKEDAKPESDIRVYDVRDLLYRVQDRSIEASALTPVNMLPYRVASKPAQGEFQRPARPRVLGDVILHDPEDKADQLRSLLTEIIDPTSWVDNGGHYGQCKFLGGQLIVTQQVENLRAIEKLLATLREDSGRMVTLDAKWVLLEPGQLEAILVPGEKGVRTVDAAALEKLGPGVVRHRGRITCFNTQQVFVSSGAARTVIIDAEVVTSGTAIAHNPEPALLHVGAMLEVRPTLCNDGKSVLLDLMSVVSADEPAPATRPADPIDRLRLEAQELRTTLVVPAGKPALIGGMSGTKSQQLYLIAEAGGTK